MIVNNRIAECLERNKAPGVILKPYLLKLIVVHRISLKTPSGSLLVPILDTELDGPGLAGKFTNRGMGTGGWIPYHILIRYDGQIDQMLPLLLQGQHAPGYNYRSTAVALAGNMTMKPARPVQAKALKWTCCRLAPLNGGLTIAGHSNLGGGSRDSNKECPGRFLDLAPIMAEAHTCRDEILDPWQQVEQAGFVL